MAMQDLINQLVEDLEFEALLNWANLLSINYDGIELWYDDEWPDRENDLRVRVAEAMGKLGEKPKPFNHADPNRKFDEKDYNELKPVQGMEIL